MKENWTTWLSFSRKERNGLILLLCLLVIVMVVPRFFYAPELPVDTNAARKLEAEIAAAQGTLTSGTANRSSHETMYAHTEPASAAEKEEHSLQEPDLAKSADVARYAGKREEKALDLPATGALFPFDPNTLSDAGWKQLGISVKVARTIFNYIAKGGYFRSPGDIGKIYGMKPADVKRLAPFVKIAASPLKNNEQIEPRTYEQTPWKKKQYSHIDINRADSAGWASLPGIGSKLAARILQYRTRLGGFHDVQQVSETWALPDSTFQKIKPWLQCRNPELQKIFINRISGEELKRHPYFNREITRAIISYREQHGMLRSAKDLQSILLLTPVSIQQIAPYIEYGNPD